MFLFFQNFHLFSNVKVFGASNIEACHSFNIYTRLLIFGMQVLCVSNIGVVELNSEFFPVVDPAAWPYQYTD